MAERKGFPKGCLIALVIAGVAIALLVAFFVIFSKDILNFSFRFVVAPTEDYVVAAEPNGMSAEEIRAIYENLDRAIDSGYVTPEELQVVLQSAQAIVGKDFISEEEAKEFLSLLEKVSKPEEISIESRHTDIADSLAPALDSM